MAAKDRDENDYDKSMFITTQEIAGLLGVPWKTSNQTAAFLKCFGIKKKGNHGFQNTSHNLYNRDDVERALVHLRQFQQGK